MSTVTEEARGRWKSILPMFGVDEKVLDGKHHPCPVCGGRDRFRFDDLHGRGTWICGGHCGAGDGFTMVCKLKGCSFVEARNLIEPMIASFAREPLRSQTTAEWIRRTMNNLWTAGALLDASSHAGLYLAARGIRIVGAGLRALRSHAHCRYENRPAPPEEHPAMLAKVLDVNGNPVALHRTYLNEAHGKLDVLDAKKVLGHLPPGSAVRLGEPMATMGIAEGIETALSAAQLYNVPVWAAINADRLMTWEPPQGVAQVLIFADHDASYAGQAAAYGLAKRLVARNLATTVHMPPNQGADWNNVLQEKPR